MKSNKLVNQKGMTLVEVMIAGIVVSVGLLAAVAMQAIASKGSYDAMQRSLSSALAQDIVERIRSNDPDEAVIATYAGTYESLRDAPTNLCDDPEPDDTPCTAAQLREVDLFEWSRIIEGAESTTGSSTNGEGGSSGGTNNGGLIGAVGIIEVDGREVTVTINWENRSNNAWSSSGGSTAAAPEETDDSSTQQLQLVAYIF